jgi:nucleotidyltransferase substrate binding protein (TIGR01987 family)
MSLTDEIIQLKKALARLEEAQALPRNQISQDATIQRFEFTFELFWKVIKIFLAEKGKETNSPKDAFRVAADLGLIVDPQPYFDYLKARNLSSHTYSEDQASQVYDQIKNFPSAVKVVLQNIPLE